MALISISPIINEKLVVFCAAVPLRLYMARVDGYEVEVARLNPSSQLAKVARVSSTDGAN